MSLRKAGGRDSRGLSPVDNRVDGRVHLPRRCPVILHAATLSLFGNPAIKISETLIEKRVEIPFDRAMCVKLNKQIIADDWRDVEPLPDTIRCRHIVAGNLSAFEARHMPATEAHGHGTGDHQQITLADPCQEELQRHDQKTVDDHRDHWYTSKSD